MTTESAVDRRFSHRTLFAIFLILISFVLIDVTISSLVDIYYDFTSSLAGISLFVAVACVLAIGTFFILKTIEDKIGALSVKKTHEAKIAKGVWTVYYLMIVIVSFVILQLVFFSEYSTGLLSIAPTISYGLAAFNLGLLAYHFFAWFTRNKTLVVLLYGLASVSASIYVVLLAIIFYIAIFLNQPATTTLETAASFPPVEAGLEEMLVITLPGILTATAFLFFWGGTIAILHSNIQRVGKTKFWILVTAPIIFFLGTLISLYPAIQGPLPEDDPNSIIIPVVITNFSQVIAIALFAIAFVSMARAIPHHQISDYMYITAYGLALFSIGIIATVSAAGYPPFGLPTVSLVGPFSFLLFIGLRRSAISASEDSELRRSIKVSARQELNLLHSIGTAEMERKLEKKVMEITKSNADDLERQSGIQPTLSNPEILNLITEVKKELDREKDSTGESKA